MIATYDATRSVGPTPNVNGLDVIEARDGVVFVRLPEALWRAAGPCRCAVCGGRESWWDTLAVPTNGRHAWTVHMPHAGDYERRHAAIARAAEVAL